jgi:hypothetical protein
MLMPVSDETKHLHPLLAEELLRWPDVTVRPMFGLRAFYRKTVVFAMLPDKRALETPTAIKYKLAGKWQSFDLRNETDIDGALDHLNRAYTKARKQP